MIGLSFVKRLVFYLIVGIFFGLLFPALFFMLSGFDRTGYFKYAAMSGGGMAVLLCLFLETARIITAAKFKNVRLEIAKTGNILFDSAAYCSMQTATIPVVEGRLFLTAENLIFKSRKAKNQSREAVIPMTSVISVDKYKFNGLKIKTTDGLCEFGVDNRKKWFDLINAKLTELNSSKECAERNV